MARRWHGATSDLVLGEEHAEFIRSLSKVWAEYFGCRGGSIPPISASVPRAIDLCHWMLSSSTMRMTQLKTIAFPHLPSILDAC